jgi:hypothetical protein
LVVILAGALAAACSHTETRTVVVPTPVDDSCTFYGYQPGTQPYAICVEREAAARRRGRMAAGYAEAQLVMDSQEACESYGLVRGTPRYDRCVQREMNYRRPG